MKASRLQQGDKIAIVSLSRGLLGESFVQHQKEIGIRRLENLGLTPVFMNNALLGIEKLSICPKLRADDLKQAFADDSIKAVLCAIGGDDTHLITEYLLSDNTFINNVQNNPKIFIGFSDSTVNHLMFFKLGLNTFYGQSFITEFGELENEMLEYSKNKFMSLFEGDDLLAIESSPYWFKERSDFSYDKIGTLRKRNIEEKGYESILALGTAEGHLLGGCIETLYSLLNYENINQPKYKVFPLLEEWENKILFLETSERETNTTPEDYQKMIVALKEYGIFDRVNGLIVGKPQDELYYNEFKEILISELNDYNIPIIYNVNFGHALPRAILPINVLVSIDTNSKTIVIEEEPLK